MSKTEKRVIIYSIAMGVLRGAHQVPFHLGIILLLISNGYDPDVALATTLAWVHGAPRLLSFLLEILGGMISIRLGDTGSFSLLPLSSFLFFVSLVLQGLLFAFSSPSSILWIAGASVILIELARSLESGSFEDVYRFSLKHEKNPSYSIANLDILSTRVMRLLQLLFALIGTPLLIFCFNQNSFNPMVVFFVISSLAYLPLIYVTLLWRNWAKVKLISSETKYQKGEIKAQILYFITSTDLINSIAVGGVLFLIISIISFSAITSSGVLAESMNGSISFLNSVIVTVLSILLPLSAIAGLSIIKIKKVDSFFRSLMGYKGILLIFCWCLLASLYSLRSEWGVLAIPFIFLLSSSITPLRNWLYWLRVPFTEKLKKTSPQLLKENFSFYYSLISGAREMAVGVFSFVPYIIVELKLDLSLSSFFVSILILLLFLMWSRFTNIKALKALVE